MEAECRAGALELGDKGSGDRVELGRGELKKLPLLWLRGRGDHGRRQGVVARVKG